MQPVIRTYDKFQKALGIDQRYTIVNKGVSRFIPAPVAPADHAGLLTSLGLELADRGRVTNINKAFKDTRTDWTADLASVASRMRSSKKIGGRPAIYKGVVQVLECGLFYCPEEVCVIDKPFVTDNFSMHSSNYILEEIGVAIVNKKEYEHKYPTWSSFSISCCGQQIGIDPIQVSIDPEQLKGSWKSNQTKIPEYTVTLEIDPETTTARLRKELAVLGNNVGCVRKATKPAGTYISNMSEVIGDLDKQFCLSMYGCHFNAATGMLTLGDTYSVPEKYKPLFNSLVSDRIKPHIGRYFTESVREEVLDEILDICTIIDRLGKFDE